MRLDVCESRTCGNAAFREQLDLVLHRIDDTGYGHGDLAASEPFTIGITGVSTYRHAAFPGREYGTLHHLARSGVSSARNARGCHAIEQRFVALVSVAVVLAKVGVEVNRARGGCSQRLSLVGGVSKISAMENATERERAPRGIWRVIAASTAGTMIEWYDFFIFGALATIISTHFYPSGSATASFLKTLATFAVGFAVRPLGALFFGRVGDLVGRKFAFLATLLIMGGSTAAIGLLPGYQTIGIAAPIILVILRLLQGLALGGEYGGAAVYVAEHAPDGRRGFYTSFIQTTATLGLFVSLAVILAVRGILGEEAFRDWGWRIPFILSILLVGISYYIRIRLQESPVFTILKQSGKTSTAPIQESFGSWSRWRVFFTILFGAAAGQAVVWYTGQFYALLFLQTVLKVPLTTSYICVAVALLLGAPLFIFFGDLSDRVG